MARPKFTPHPEHRNLVKSMAGMGIRHEDIAKKVGIRSPKTLRKHFREELDLGSTDALYNVARTLYNMATRGDCPAATIFYLKSRGGWREKPTFEPGSIAPPPFIVAREQEGGRV
jgi:hypothetical protein